MAKSIYELPTAKPEEVGFSSDRMARIGTTMKKHVDSGEAPGIVTLVARHGKVVHFEAYGMRDIEAGTPIAKDSMFRIASMGKLFTAVAVMILYEDGLLSLNDPISRFLPAFKNPVVVTRDPKGTPYIIPPLPRDLGKKPIIGSEIGVSPMVMVEPARREIVVRDCLTHTTGVATLARAPMSMLAPLVATGRHASSYAPFREDGTVEPFFKEHVVTQKERVELMAKIPLIFQPGTEWDYGPGTDIAGVLVEVISGKTLEEFLKERIFKPLGMHDTAFYPPKEKILSRLVTLYNVRDKKLIPIEKPSETQQFKGPEIAFSGSGGEISTIPDCARFAQMLVNGGELDGIRILGRKTVELMMTNHTGNIRTGRGEGFGFGLGGYVRTSMVGDNIACSPEIGSIGMYGWGGGFNSILFVDPKEDLIGLGATQLSGGLPNIWTEFQRLIYISLS